MPSCRSSSAVYCSRWVAEGGSRAGTRGWEQQGQAQAHTMQRFSRQDQQQQTFTEPNLSGWGQHWPSTCCLLAAHCGSWAISQHVHIVCARVAVWNRGPGQGECRAAVPMAHSLAVGQEACSL